MTKVFGQKSDDYIRYYNLCNEGDKQTYLKNYKLAFEKYDSAFALVHYQHAEKLEKAASAASRIDNKQMSTIYLRQSILNGVDPTAVSDKVYKKLKHYKRFKDLKDSAEIFHQNYLTRINRKYALEIDSLYFIDQNIIRGNKYVKGNYKIDTASLPKNKFDLDSVVFLYLIKLIQKNGFPSEENIGGQGYQNVWVLFHHTARLPGNEKYIDMLTDALKKGQYAPSDYAWMYDQSRMFKREKPYFYYGVADPSKLTDSEIQEIESHRRLFGVKPFESTKITVDGKRISQRTLW
ncbi:MAG TPA: hypothetical protein VN026_08020 [Bacteroidia bacterium]|nr:hypothetical protein [Bacteroidia bacterium]